MFTNDKGIQTQFRGGPPPYCRPLSQTCHIVSEKANYIIPYPGWKTPSGYKKALDYDSNASSKTVLKGIAVHDIDTCFRTISKSIDSAEILYHPVGPNSNSFVKTLLHKCGPWLPSDFAGDAPSLLPVVRLQVPGWGYPDLVKCIYSKFDHTCN